MKILFGIQATGNGHISRSTEIYKILKQHPEVEKLDVLISGGKAKMSLPFEVTYEYKGLSFYYGKKGKISILKSIGKANMLSMLVGLWKVPFREYDLIISDFEPITLWGAKLARCKAGRHRQYVFLLIEEISGAAKVFHPQFIHADSLPHAQQNSHALSKVR